MQGNGKAGIPEKPQTQRGSSRCGRLIHNEKGTADQVDAHIEI